MAFGLETFRANGVKQLGDNYWMPALLDRVTGRELEYATTTYTKSFPSLTGCTVSVVTTNEDSFPIGYVNYVSATISISYSSGYPVVTFTKAASTYVLECYNIMLTGQGSSGFGIDFKDDAGNPQAGYLCPAYHLKGIYTPTSVAEIPANGTELQGSTVFGGYQYCDGKSRWCNYRLYIPATDIPESVTPRFYTEIPTHPNQVRVTSITKGSQWQGTRATGWWVEIQAFGFVPYVYVFVQHGTGFAATPSGFGMSLYNASGVLMYDSSQNSALLTKPGQTWSVTAPPGSGPPNVIYTSPPASDNQTFTVSGLPTKALMVCTSVDNFYNASTTPNKSGAQFWIEKTWSKMWSRTGDNIYSTWREIYTYDGTLSSYTYTMPGRSMIKQIANAAFYD